MGQGVSKPSHPVGAGVDDDCPRLAAALAVIP